MNSIIKKLIKIADQLDRIGQGELANEIDQNILPQLQEEPELQEVEIEIPEDEKLMLEDVLRSLQDSLGE